VSPHFSDISSLYGSGSWLPKAFQYFRDIYKNSHEILLKFITISLYNLCRVDDNPNLCGRTPPQQVPSSQVPPEIRL
jgi:hypothetical protein